MVWSRTLLTLLACAQLTLVASHRFQSTLPAPARKPHPEGISRLVDRIAHSKYGLAGALPGAAPVAHPEKLEGIPLSEVLTEADFPEVPNVFPVEPAGEQAPDWLWPIIEEESRARSLSPHLIESMIRTESGFRPEAVSPVGAQGLMQLMPETAALVGVADAFDARQNVAGGAQYMAWQLHDFGGDLSLALAAYNAGPAAVRRWGGIPPYAETQNYVRRVMEDYQRKLQTAPSNENPELPPRFQEFPAEDYSR